MANYGIIINGELIVSDTMLLNYKPLVYATIPDDFDEATQFITQDVATDYDDHIFVGVQMHDLDLNELVMDEEELPY